MKRIVIRGTAAVNKVEQLIIEQLARHQLLRVAALAQDQAHPGDDNRQQGPLLINRQSG